MTEAHFSVSRFTPNRFKIRQNKLNNVASEKYSENILRLRIWSFYEYLRLKRKKVLYSNKKIGVLLSTFDHFEHGIFHAYDMATAV